MKQVDGDDYVAVTDTLEVYSDQAVCLTEKRCSVLVMVKAELEKDTVCSKDGWKRICNCRATAQEFRRSEQSRFADKTSPGTDCWRPQARCGEILRQLPASFGEAQ